MKKEKDERLVMEMVTDEDGKDEELCWERQGRELKGNDKGEK